MKRKTARLSVSDLGSIDTVIAAFTDHYGRLMGKRFDAGYFVKHVAKEGTHACNYLLTTDVEMEPVPGYRFANWELGYGDFHNWFQVRHKFGGPEWAREQRGAKGIS